MMAKIQMKDHLNSKTIQTFGGQGIRVRNTAELNELPKQKNQVATKSNHVKDSPKILNFEDIEVSNLTSITRQNPSTVAPNVNLINTSFTNSRPRQSWSFKGPHTDSCTMWVHLQTSICTEWEQNKFPLSSIRNIHSENNPSTSSSSVQIPKKPKTIHRCILQGAAKAKDQSIKISCHLCKRSYSKYGDYYAHLLNQACSKAKEDVIVGDKPAQSRDTDTNEGVVQLSQDEDDDVHVESVFFHNSAKVLNTLSTSKPTTTSQTSSLPKVNSSSHLQNDFQSQPLFTKLMPKPTATITSGQTSMIHSAFTTSSSQKSVLPLRFDLNFSIAKLPQSKESPNISKPLDLSPNSIDNGSIQPLNLSKRTLVQPRGSKRARVDYDFTNRSSSFSFSPDNESPSIFNDSSKALNPSPRFISTKMMTKLSSPTSDSYKTIYRQSSLEKLPLSHYTNKQSSLVPMSAVIEPISPPLASPSLPITFNPGYNLYSNREVSSTEQKSSVYEEKKLCPHLLASSDPPVSLAEHADHEAALSKLKVQITKLLGNIFSESRLMGDLDYPNTDILTILKQVLKANNNGRFKVRSVDDFCTENCKRVAAKLNQNQVRFQQLRCDVDVTRHNIRKLLEIYQPRSSVSLQTNAVEFVLDEILNKFK